MSSFIEIKDLHFSYVNELEEPPHVPWGSLRGSLAA